MWVAHLDKNKIKYIILFKFYLIYLLQNLTPDAQVLSKVKSVSSQRLNAKGKSPRSGKAGKKNKGLVEESEELRLPPAEAAFLPDFPLRGDLEELDFEVN